MNQLNRELGIILGLALVSVGVLSLVSTPLAWGSMTGFAGMGNMMGGVMGGAGNAEHPEGCSEEQHAEMTQQMGNVTMPHMDQGQHHGGGNHHQGMGNHMSNSPATGQNSTHCGN